MKASQSVAVVVIALSVGFGLLPAGAFAHPNPSFSAPTMPAARKGDNFVIPARRSTEFHVVGTNGYSVFVFAGGGRVSLSAANENGSATYSTRGVTSPTRIEASFGDLGSVAVRFKPSGSSRRQRPEKGCHGRRENVQRGVFLGKIVFEGEQSYTTLDASRATGSEVVAFKQVCHFEEEEETQEPYESTVLTASSKSASAGLFAFKFVPKAHRAACICLLNASVVESRPHLEIIRAASARLGSKAFTATKSDEAPAVATIAPPAPFSGSASYEKPKGSPPTWTGSLSAAFPGLGVVPLTGSDWMAELNPKGTQASGGSFTAVFISG